MSVEERRTGRRNFPTCYARITDAISFGADVNHMKPEETIDFPIRWAWHRIARMYNTEAAKHGGTMSIGYVLLNIDPEGTPSTKLGPKMGMESRSLVRTLQAMEDDGLIRREADHNDKRVVRILLTAKGKQKRDLSKGSVIRFNQAVQQRLTEKELRDFRAAMNTINAILDDKQLFA